MSDNSWFDPPIENYRFYFKGENNTSTNPNTFFMQVTPVREHIDDDDINTEVQHGNKHELYSSTNSRDIMMSDENIGRGSKFTSKKRSQS